MNSLIEFLIHDNVKIDNEAYKKQRFFIISAMLTLMISLSYAILCYFIDYNIALYVILFYAISHLVLFYLSFINVSLRIIGNLFAGMTFLGFGAITLTSGGVSSAIVAWYISTKISAFWYSKRKDGYIWGALTVVWLISLSIYELGGNEIPILYDNHYRSLFSSIMHIGVLLYFMLVLKIYEDWKLDAIKIERDLVKSKQNILNILAHDLKNPLMIFTLRLANLTKINNANGFSQPQDPKWIKNMDSLKGTVKSMNEILDGLLDEAKNGKSLKNLIVNTKEIIMDCLNSGPIELAKEKDISIHIQSEKSTGSFIGDKTNFFRVLNNITSNAIKYSPSKSKITINIDIKKNNNIISIKDEGLGLTKDQISKIFTPFSSVGNIPTNGEESHGIGLSITKELLIKEFKGNLEVESLGKNLGSTFIITLPLSA